MPESVRDRPTCSHEYLFLLAKSKRYFYDANAIKEESLTNDARKPYGSNGAWALDGRDKWSEGAGQPQCRDASRRNKRSVWTIATCPFPGARFASFPPALVEPCIKAGMSERGCCPDCGAPWERVVEKGLTAHDGDTASDYKQGGNANRLSLLRQAARERGGEYVNTSKTIGWRPTCSCYDTLYRRDLPRTKSARKRRQQDAQDAWFPRARQRPGPDTWDTVPAIVLDLFGGAGTTGLVADQLGRDCILIELKDEYGAMARERILSDLGPMFTQVQVENCYTESEAP